MKRFIQSSEDMFGAADITPTRSGLSVSIRSEHGGVKKCSPDISPRVKIEKDDISVSVSISDSPAIFEMPENIKESDRSAFREGIQYVARNYDVFLKHYMDTSFEFDDEALFNELRLRGQYK